MPRVSNHLRPLRRSLPDLERLPANRRGRTTIAHSEKAMRVGTHNASLAPPNRALHRARQPSIQLRRGHSRSLDQFLAIDARTRRTRSSFAVPKRGVAGHWFLEARPTARLAWGCVSPWDRRGQIRRRICVERRTVRIRLGLEHGRNRKETQTGGRRSQKKTAKSYRPGKRSYNQEGHHDPWFRSQAASRHC